MLVYLLSIAPTRPVTDIYFLFHDIDWMCILRFICISSSGAITMYMY